MDLVQVRLKLASEDKISKYISMIRKFDKSLPLSEIKRRIESNDYAIEFDLDDDSFDYHIEYVRSMNFLEFLKSLEKAGAVLEIYLHNRPTTFEILGNWIHTRKEIAEDVEKYPD